MESISAVIDLNTENPTYWSWASFDMGGLSFEMESKFEKWGVERVLKNRAYNAKIIG